MRLYETAFLIAPNLPEEENAALIEKMAAVVSEHKGKMVNLDNWGKKKLAYPIEKFEEAFYIFFLYEGKPELPIELERRFKQTEAIIRYLTIKRDETENVRKPRKQVSRPPRQSEPAAPAPKAAETAAPTGSAEPTEVPEETKPAADKEEN